MRVIEFNSIKPISEEAISLITELSSFTVSQFEDGESYKISIIANTSKEFENFFQLIIKLGFEDNSEINEVVSKLVKYPIKKFNLTEKDNWKLFLKDIQLSNDFNIKMPWSKFKYKKFIIINPSLAFGTGHHETTLSCLRIMNKLKVENFYVQSMVDIGSGSGILSFFGQLLFSCSSLGIDNDYEALNQGYANKKLNKHLNGNSNFIQSNEPIINKKNDLVVINISIDYIKEHLEFVLNNLSNECYLILSGVLFKDLKDLKKILDKFNISINKVYYLQNWITLGLIKNV